MPLGQHIGQYNTFGRFHPLLGLSTVDCGEPEPEPDGSTVLLLVSSLLSVESTTGLPTFRRTRVVEGILICGVYDIVVVQFDRLLILDTVATARWGF
jgi:hypothetical protein